MCFASVVERPEREADIEGIFLVFRARSSHRQVHKLFEGQREDADIERIFLVLRAPRSHGQVLKLFKTEVLYPKRRGETRGIVVPLIVL